LETALRNFKSAIVLCVMLFALCHPAVAQQPTKFEFVIHLKATKQMGVTIRPMH
jgi:hypothetical protein